MKRIFSLALIALATAAVAQTPNFTPVPYSEFRQERTIDAAIAAMPSSDLQGTFNRLSAILQRGQVQEANPGGGIFLPANVMRNLEATLLDLQSDLSAENVGAIDGNLDHQLSLLHAVRQFAFRRQIQLYGAFDVCPPCPPCDAPPPCTPCTCLTNDPDFYATLDQIAKIQLLDAYTDLYNSLTEAEQATLGLVAPAAFEGSNFVGATGTMLTIKGVESIDD